MTEAPDSPDFGQPAFGVPAEGAAAAHPPAVAPAAAVPKKRASLGARLLAKVIDIVVLVVALAPGVIMAGVVGDAENPVLANVGGALFLLGMGGQAVAQWVLITRRGQSIGKVVTRIHIRRQDGRSVDFVAGVILREWIVALAVAAVNLVTCGFLGWVVSVVDAVSIFGDERHCMHDMVAGTDVLEGHAAEYEAAVAPDVLGAG